MLSSLELLQCPYLRDLLDQPAAMERTVTGFSPVVELNSLSEDLRSGRFARVVLTGMGGSYHMLCPLHLRLTQAGFNSVLAETSELLDSLATLLTKALVIALSQSGASAETVRLLDRRGPTIVGVTNTAESPLAQKADVTLLTRAGEEGGVACKTAVTSLAALEWLSAHLAGDDLGRARAELETAAPALETYLVHWKQHVQTLAGILKGIEHAFVVGRGRSLAAAGLGGMIQKEAAHVHGEGMSSAAFRHGPFEMLGPDCFVLVMEGDAEVAAKNRQLVDDVVATGARGALCGLQDSDGPFALPSAPSRIRPILELLPPQMMSLAFAYLKGREPGKFERITKVTTVE
jgi:glucosamine--fructose-6-phosphate aminotransferase (isomerizing)